MAVCIVGTSINNQSRQLLGHNIKKVLKNEFNLCRIVRDKSQSKLFVTVYDRNNNLHQADLKFKGNKILYTSGYPILK